MTVAPDDERATAYVSRLRAALSAELRPSGLLLDPGRYTRLRQDLMVDGGRLWHDLTLRTDPHVNLDTLYRGLPAAGVSPLALPRVLGFGYAQGLALSEWLLGTPDAAAATRAAWFNFGIVLFDAVCDHLPAEARQLSDLMGPGGMEQLLCGRRPEFQPAEHVIVRFLQGIVLRYFTELELGSASAAFRQEFATAIQRMHEAETWLTLRATEPTSLARLWARLRAKSALPMWTMALTCARHDDGAWNRLMAERASVLAAGRALWILDDLIDAHEDRQAGAWSRPWLLLRRESGSDARDWARLLASGIIEAEARQLKRALLRAPAAMREVLQATVHSWLCTLPESA
ncbi:hypothetical protein OV208_40220 [Corallococcus sp. bb12-1]|uniref:hypothetical protein n=1 Tax=Corallococcus sp. bb12-1 TaxID=2996784 RepID=UPI002271F36E|nr:hypothetical protein [Corallococcus sp. bb12-1]MCY1047594.1 hypothetical protein [Corallococcus sp. bb12-1]